MRPRMFAIALGVSACLLWSPIPAGAADVVQPGESIQQAIDAAQPGDTVRLAAGGFPDNVTITTDDVPLRGAGSSRDGTVLMPASTPTSSPCTDPESDEVQGICVM